MRRRFFPSGLTVGARKRRVAAQVLVEQPVVFLRSAITYSPSLPSAPQPHDRVTQPALRGFRIHVGNLGDLLYGQSGFLAQQERLALRLRQASDVLLQPRRLTLEIEFRLGGRLRNVRYFFQQRFIRVGRRQRPVDWRR